MNGLIFDLILLGIVIITILVGRKKGLLRMAFSICVVVIAIILANIISPMVSNGIQKLKIADTVREKTYTAIHDVLKNNELDFSGLVEEYKIPETISNAIEKSVEGIKTAKNEELSRKLSDKLTEITIKIVSFVIVAVLVLILLGIISAALRIVSKLPVIETLDKTGGLLLGVVLGLMIAFIICLALYMFGLFNVSGPLAEVPASSYAMKIFDKLGLIKWIIK